VSFLPYPLAESTSDMRAIHNYEGFVPGGSEFSVTAMKGQALYSEGIWFVRSMYMFEFYVQKKTFKQKKLPLVRVLVGFEHVQSRVKINMGPILEPNVAAVVM
jgi:hypothetical protein